jgi:excisionase family DNA binding protein
MKEIFKRATNEQKLDQMKQKRMTEIPFRLFHSREETATLLGVSVRTVDDMVKKGEIESLKLRGRRLVPRSAIEGYLQQVNKAS